MQQDQIIFEIGKVAAQGAFALLVARLAVNWALDRYKSEKTWERRLTAYADSVAALSEMRLLLGRWMDDVEHSRERTKTWEEAQADRYRVAKRRFEETEAVAHLLLDTETSKLLSKLHNDLDRVDERDLHAQWSNEYSLIDDALVTLTWLGRKALC